MTAFQEEFKLFSGGKGFVKVFDINVFLMTGMQKSSAHKNKFLCSLLVLYTMFILSAIFFI